MSEVNPGLSQDLSPTPKAAVGATEPKFTLQTAATPTASQFTLQGSNQAAVQAAALAPTTRRMKRGWIVIVVLVLLLIGGYAVYAGGLLKRPQAANNAQAATVAQAEQTPAGANEKTTAVKHSANGRVQADASVIPVQYADLSFTRSGVLEKLLVKEGEQVAAGQLLAQLNAGQQQVAVASAQATLQKAQAQLTKLQNGARTQEIEQAKAALNAAQARYQRLAQAGLPSNIKAAEAALAASQASLAKVLEGPSEQQLIAAQADLATAEASLKQAQSAYNLVKWRNDIGALPQSAQLEQATAVYEAAKARWEDLKKGASAADVSNASAQVRRSQAQLDELKTGMPSDLAAAEADVRASQAQLDLLMAGARPEELAAAQADVAAATAALQQALVSLSETEIHAPFAGQVAVVNARLGEQVTPGAVALRLADLAKWQIETEDLTELDVVSIAPGKQVTLTFDAIPDLTMNGTVRYIRPIGGDRRGDVVYTVVIDPARQDKRLLWNMTTVVAFDVK
ncbi:MAG: HlyD family efflux transporter periplasmic adaptor subunit [Caldilineaceae bacterium]